MKAVSFADTGIVVSLWLTNGHENPPKSPFSKGGLDRFPPLVKGGEGGFEGVFRSNTFCYQQDSPIFKGL